MGPRPADFDEQLIRQSPTFIKWQGLAKGEKLRYACREFTKDHDEDEERLMRRIMIARRNNIKDHQVLKRARELTSKEAKKSLSAKVVKVESASSRKRRSATMFSDTEVSKEMDVAAVEATRSFRKWKSLEDGAVFVYNQRYIKGKENHEWLLKKNIWRRMRYRRENKKIVQKLKVQTGEPTAPVGRNSKNRGSRAVVPTVQKLEEVDANDVVHNPLDAVADSAALDAAARLAAAATVDEAAVAAATAAASHRPVEV